MQEFMIDNGIVIDDIDGVVKGIAKLSGKNTPDPHTIKRFITNEKSTKFYIDNKCSCKMQPDRDTVYLWLDSGFTSYYGDPIMISLLNNRGGGYSGHICGTMEFLAGSIGDYFPYNRRNITRNLGALRVKYDNKISGRDNAHITDEQEYLIRTSNEASSTTEIADLIKGLNITFAETEAVAEVEAVEETIDDEPRIQMNRFEEEITIGLLLDKMDEREAYIDELLDIIEKLNTENKLTKEKMQDFVYETDYDKVKSMAGRLSYGVRFSAIILGACPHKVSMLGDYSSFVEKCKNDDNLPDAYETRTNTGELKLTKESFRKALEMVVRDLREKQLS